LSRSRDAGLQAEVDRLLTVALGAVDEAAARPARSAVPEYTR